MTRATSAPSKASVRATYEAIAESFSQTRSEPWPEVVEFARRLPPDARILDLGCGNGRHVSAFASEGRRCVGVDFSRRLLRIAKETLTQGSADLRPHLVEADATALPLRDGRFDACTCVAVLHHLPSFGDRLQALREVRRILAPGGLALLSVWAIEQPRFRATAEAHRGRDPAERGDVEVPWTLPDGTLVPRYYHLFEEDELRRLIIDSGLRAESFFRSPGNHFALARRD